jgi:hypothetical protein
VGELQHNVAARDGLLLSSGPEHHSFCDFDLPFIFVLSDLLHCKFRERWFDWCCY